jgi:ferric-dicitrate binding protein FerR (iron transport regulator)
MSMDCEMLGALLSERRRGELSSDESRALDAHLARCPRCREEAKGLESVLARVELPPISAAELEALRSRRFTEPPRRTRRSGAWQVPAVLLAAAAAAVLTVSIRRPQHRATPVQPVETAVAPGSDAFLGDSPELFPDLTSGTDDRQDTLEDDVLSLEGQGLFGNIDG